ncbi:hypothetical protein AAG570_002867 [Ranatra chinensis]|uniref:Tubulin alpha chain n=1 Tax=Ranatra chinensis TaxID=642074 RepID=A0ABD0Y5K1_9HEMI
MCWELYCLEHDILPSGFKSNPEPSSSDTCDAIYSRTSSGSYIPRAIFVDLEPTVLDEMRVGVYRDLYNRDNMISGKEDAGSNFARGYYSVGNEISGPCMGRLRIVAETCDSLQGFLFFHSFGGGTGSGLTSNLMAKMKNEYSKATRVSFILFPSPTASSVVVEPYNAVLASHATMDTAGCCFAMDNEALYSICESKLSVAKPNFTNINRVIAQAVAGVTGSLRFQGESVVNLEDLQTNLIPFERLHFPAIAYAPLVTPQTADKEIYTADQLVNSCLQPESSLVKCNLRQGRCMASCLLFRGGVAPAEANAAVTKLKSSGLINLVGVNAQPPSAIPGGDMAACPASLAFMSNSSALVPLWSRINTKFDLMYSKRAYVHHYVGEGMEEGEFQEARDDIATLEKDYETATK